MANVKSSRSPKNRTAEQVFERFLFNSRWLLAPMYLGLVAAVGMMVVIFMRDLFYYVPQLMTLKSEQVILVALTLIDITLAANLIVIVMFSGYENFVSKFDFDAGEERPEWMGKVDFSGLKMKLIASIVAISGCGQWRSTHKTFTTGIIGISGNILRPD